LFIFSVDFEGFIPQDGGSSSSRNMHFSSEQAGM
jgi:hypothetical protein